MEDDFSTVAYEDLRDENIRKPNLKQISILYSISILLLIFLGSRAQRAEFYSGILITEFILILLPPLALLLIYRYDIPKVLRLNKISLKNLTLIFWIMIVAIPVTGILNLGNYWLIKYIFGKIVIQQPPVAEGSVGLLVSVLIIGGSAGICEEVMFRGVIMRGFERFGITIAILSSAFLFGLMHVDFEKLLGTFLLGGLIGFIVYRTNSLFGGMFAHFTNNSIAVLAVYSASKATQKLKDMGMSGSTGGQAENFDFSNLANIPQAQLIAAIIVWSILGLICISVFIRLIISFIKNTSNQVESIPYDTNGTLKTGLVWLLPGIAMISLIYVAQGLKLKEMSVWWIDGILRLMGLK